MPATQLRAAQHKSQPWKNGLGVSQIIADCPQGAGFDAVLWQVGSTKIAADCPFSSLPGLDRLFMVLEGAGVELTCIDEMSGKIIRARIDMLRTLFAFRGDWRTTCRLLGGPVRVFNVITRRGRANAQVGFSSERTLKKAAGETLLVVALGTLDAWLLADAQEETWTLPSLAAERVALVRIRASVS